MKTVNEITEKEIIDMIFDELEGQEDGAYEDAIDLADGYIDYFATIDVHSFFEPSGDYDLPPTKEATVYYYITWQLINEDSEVVNCGTHRYTETN